MLANHLMTAIDNKCGCLDSTGLEQKCTILLIQSGQKTWFRELCFVYL